MTFPAHTWHFDVLQELLKQRELRWGGGGIGLGCARAGALVALRGSSVQTQYLHALLSKRLAIA